MSVYILLLLLLLIRHQWRTCDEIGCLAYVFLYLEITDTITESIRHRLFTPMWRCALARS